MITTSPESEMSLKVRLEKIADEVAIGQKMDFQLFNSELDKSKKEIYTLVLRFLKQ